MATALAPRKPMDRGEVESRTPLRIRERIAAVIWFFYVNRVLSGILLGAIGTLVIEHNDVTFPAIAAFATGLFHAIAAAFEWAISLLPGHAK